MMLDVKFEYVNVPSCKDFKTAFKNALSKVKTVEKLLKISVFAASESVESYLENVSFTKEEIKERFGLHAVEVSYVAQNTLHAELAIELVYANDTSTVLYKTLGGVSYVIVRAENKKMLLISGLIGDDKQSINEQSNAVFKTIEGIFSLENMAISSIVRQWNYIPDITKMENNFQHYQQFNDARSLFYEKTSWGKGYPAATGIGTKNAPLLIDVIAMEGHKEELPLHNSKQIDAHIYSDDVLLGIKEQSLKKRSTPKFERAKLIIENSGASVFVSGTAAIMGEESLALDNAGNQTDITIDHIENLVAKGLSKTYRFRLIPEFESVRAYVKNLSDYTVVRQVCEKRLPGVPVVYVEADICRDELLVEIEAFVKI
ncbi:MAG: hypothetical protein COB81_04205 [Flavobacteriaceae bacterium]|nr:MAG: hypothetical protein COB81_04205 [Flavobacteriaceae bacterium]